MLTEEVMERRREEKRERQRREQEMFELEDDSSDEDAEPDFGFDFTSFLKVSDGSLLSRGLLTTTVGSSKE